jgi:hypothetical protein
MPSLLEGKLLTFLVFLASELTSIVRFDSVLFAWMSDYAGRFVVPVLDALRELWTDETAEKVGVADCL